MLGTKTLFMAFCALSEAKGMDINMIKIVFKNGCVCKWKKKQWTDYKYDGKCFIVIKNDTWVGMYNMDSIVSIIVK